MRTSVALTTAALLCCTANAYGQELRGTLYSGDSLRLLGGVIVEATDRSGHRLAVSLSDSRGRFVLVLPAGQSVALRALRIGYRPGSLGETTLAAGDTVERVFYAGESAVVLDRVVVAEAQRCGPLEESGLRAATLFGEARKAIEASRLQAGGAELNSVWSIYSRRLTRSGRPLGDPVERRYEGPTERPFASLAADSLEAFGYVRESDGELQFFAPDADVLLSDSFARTHCFVAVEGSGERSHQVGVSFSPSPERRHMPEISGTFWLDAQSLELERLEFAYVGLPPALSGHAAGGEVVFARLATGSWLVGEWSLRMPRISEAMEHVVGRTSRPILRVRSLEEAGGIVQEVRLAGRTLLERKDQGRFVTPALDAETVVQLCHLPPVSRDAVLWGHLRGVDSAAVEGATVIVANRTSPSAAPTSEWRATTERDGFWYACGVPRGAVLRVDAVRSGQSLASSYELVPLWEGGSPVNLTAASSGSADTLTLAGTAYDSLRTDSPWADANVALLGTSRLVRTSSSGVFAFSGLAAGVGRVAIWDDFVREVGLPPLEIAVDLQSTVQDFAAVLPRQAAGGDVKGKCVLGRVVDSKGDPMPDAALRVRWRRLTRVEGEWSATSPELETRTRVDGRYTLCGLPADGEPAGVVDGAFSIIAAAEGRGSVTVGLELAESRLTARNVTLGVPDDVRALAGRVESGVGAPLGDALVTVVGSDSLWARSGPDGSWRIAGVPLRSTRLEVRAVGFAPVEFDIEPLGSSFPESAVRLVPAAQALAAVNITAEVGNLGYREAFEDRRKSYAFGTFLDDSLLARQSYVTSDFVISHVSKARAATAGARETSKNDPKVRLIPPGQKKIAFEVDSGFGAMSLCNPRWFIDGVDFGIPAAAEEAVFLREAKRIEVYKAALAPPQYNDFDGCGVILIWTR